MAVLPASPEEAVATTDLRSTRWTVLVDLTFSLFICVVLRVAGLGAKSVWLDEYFSAAYLDRPTLWAFIHDQRPENWEMTPLYYVLQYGWAHVFGGGIAGVRAFSIACAVATVPVLYLLGRSCFGRVAGLVAALLFSLSPFQIFHGVGLRPYALVTLLGVTSVFVFLNGLDRNDRVGIRWLGWAALLNGLLMWTHAFTPLLAAAQGTALLLQNPRQWKRWVGWGIVHGILLVPVLWWLSSTKPAPPAPAIAPGLGELLGTVLSQDTRTTFWTLSEENLADTAYAPILAWKNLLFLLQQVFCIAGMAGLAVVGWRALKHAGPSRRLHAWLLVWLLLPFCMLWFLAQVWIPTTMQARYAAFAMPALYLILGAAVQGASSKRVRWFLAGLVLAPMSAHAIVAPVLPMYPAYLEVNRMFREQARPGDSVLAPDYNVLRVLAFQTDDRALFEFRHVPDLLRGDPDLKDLLKTNHLAWVVFAGNPAESADAEQFKSVLARDGLGVDCRVFAGMQRLYVYRVELVDLTLLP